MASQGRSLSQLLIRALRLCADCSRPIRISPTVPHGCGTSGRPQPFRNVVASRPHLRLRKPTPATLLGTHHARPVDQRDRLRQGVHRIWQPLPRPSRRPSAGMSAPTCPPPSCTKMPSATARASSRPTARWSCAPASTPVARPRTSSSSTSRPATTRSGGERSTGRSPRRTTSASAPVWSRIRHRGTCTARTASSVRPRRIAARCASTPRPPGRASSRATCSAGRPTSSAPASRRTSRSSASPRSRPIPRPREHGRAPRSSSISSGWRS